MWDYGGMPILITEVCCLLAYAAYKKQNYDTFPEPSAYNHVYHTCYFFGSGKVAQGHLRSK